MKRCIFFVMLAVCGQGIQAGQTPEQMKSVLDKIGRIQVVEDGHYDSVYHILQRQIRESAPVERAIWHSLTAEFLYHYYLSDRYAIFQRTPVEGTPDADFQTWDLMTLVGQIVHHYRESLKESDLLLQTDIKGYAVLMDSMASVEYRPTVYDWLAFRALDFYSISIREVPVPLRPFRMDNPLYFSENEHFIRIAIPDSDSLSFPYLSLTLMQQITRIRLDAAPPYPLIDITLRRLNYVKEKALTEDKEDLYREALMKLERKYSNREGYEDIALAMGRFYEERSTQYDTILHPEYRMDLVKAIEWYEKSVQYAPSSIAASNARERMENIRSKNFFLTISPVVTPDRPSLISVNYKNCDSLHVRIIDRDLPAYQNLKSKDYSDRTYMESLIRLPYVSQFSIPAENRKDFRPVTGDGIMPALPVGRYSVVASSSGFRNNASMENFLEMVFDVSNIEMNYRRNGNRYEFLVTDRTTGKLLPKAKLTLSFFRNYSEKNSLGSKEILTDRDGRASLDIGHYSHTVYIKMDVSKGNDKLQFRNHDSRAGIYHYPFTEQKTTLQRIYFFTDRSIYRPGQTVYYKGIIVEESEAGSRIVTAKEGEVELLDANRQKITNARYVTNDYGSFSGSFVLPATSGTGYFCLRSFDQDHYFSVEEYKRPQFEITLEPPAASYALNEKVTVSGKTMAFAGYAIDGAEVKYRVIRQTYFPFWRGTIPPFVRSPQQEIAQGTAVTGADGLFTIEFTAHPDPSPVNGNPVYAFVITADVTDINGENQTASMTLRIGTVNRVLELDLPENVIMNRDSVCFPLTARNLNGQKVPAEVNYEVIFLETPFRYYHTRKGAEPDVRLFEINELKRYFPYVDLENQADKERWKELEIVAKGKKNTATDSCLRLTGLSFWKEGYYKIRLQSSDSAIATVDYERIVFFYKERESQCRAYEALWLQTDKEEVSPGESLTFHIGSYMEDANVWMEIISNHKVLVSEWMKLHKSRKDFLLQIGDEHTGTLVCNLYTNKDNYRYALSKEITVTEKNRKIRFEWITFRDKLLPGAEESWTLKIKGENGEKLAGEILASMYDASLDAFVDNTYHFPVFGKRTARMNYSWSTGSDYVWGNFRSLVPYTSSVTQREYYRLVWAYSVANGYPVFVYSGGGIMSADGALSPSVRSSEIRFKEMDADEMVVAEQRAPLAGGEGNGAVMETLPVYRKDFAETAFFFPRMNTDEEGNITFTFTLPDALTRWKFQSVAHTRDLRTGTLMRYAETGKPLMVVSNPPRFFRENDTLRFSAKIVNMAEGTISGKVKIQFFNASDNQPLAMSTDGNERSFSVSKGNSGEVSFTLHIPEGMEAVVYRIMATQDPQENEPVLFSDGEERTIPVLPNRMLVTETLPLSVRGGETKTYTFDKMSGSSPTRRNFRYTLEFTSNPVWYALLSLPYLMEYPYDCSEQIFGRIFANSVASYVVNSSPRIKNIFDTWKNTTPSLFCSQLEKNEELKNIVLEETPWVLEAQDESVRRQQVGLLFDLNRMANENRSAIKKLGDNQNGDGGWPWFAGGFSDPYITRYIIAGFGHLRALGVNVDPDKSQLEKAIQYTDRLRNKEYRQLKDAKNSKMEADHLNPGIIYDVYSRSFHTTEYPVPSGAEESYRYYTDQARRYWSKRSIYEKALISLALFRSGDEKTAREIVAHIKERAQYSEEMGMFWKKEGMGWFWYEAPIERQAILIEAFSLITGDQESVEKMQQWLLKQKQTQNWGNTKATALACYSLFMNGNTSLPAHSDVSITVGKEKINLADAPETEKGTGYFKKSWDKEGIKADMAVVTITKPSKGIAWGGLYWQYFEDIDKITPSQSALTLHKNIYKVELNERGEVLVPVTAHSPLRTGDKIRVRMEIRTDRDMEYVHVKDMRASAFEPVQVMSRYKSQGALRYYESTRDAATHFFIDYLPKGTHVFEYDLRVSQSGSFSNGIGMIQCMYAPEFSAHTEGLNIRVP